MTTENLTATNNFFLIIVRSFDVDGSLFVL